MTPLLARLRFGAGDWQMYLITASVPTFLAASIFWDALLRRITLRRYLMIHFCVAILPMAAIALAQNYWHLLACQMLAAIGAAGWSPINGALLKKFYSDSVRGRVFGVLLVPFNLGFMATALGTGIWLSHDADSFRVFMPLLVGAQAVGIAILIGLVGATRSEGGATVGSALTWRGVLAPLRGLAATLRADRRFLRYEAAFMTYGAGFMICDVLFPLLVTDRLGLDYEQVSKSAHVVFRGFMVALAFPLGWMLDRIGPARTCAASFALLALYPIGLLLASGALGLGVASALYGVAMAGVFQGWMLGPVTMASSPDKVSHYVAVHTTLVGIRGVLFQALGMALFRWTGMFEFPLAVAACAFVWAAWQMRRLHDASRAVQPTAVAKPVVDQ